MDEVFANLKSVVDVEALDAYRAARDVVARLAQKHNDIAAALRIAAEAHEDLAGHLQAELREAPAPERP